MRHTSDTRRTDDASFSMTLLGFVHRLRAATIPVSMVEAIDAAQALPHVDLADRDQLRDALRAALVKNVEDEAVFESLFDVYFAVQRERAAQLAVATSLDRAGDEVAGEEGDEHLPGDPAQLLQALLEALRTDDRDALRALATMAVEQHAGIDAERSFSEPYYLYRVLRQLELSELLRAAIAKASEVAEDPSPLDERLLREELARRVEDLRRLISQEIRRQLTETKGASLAADVVQERPIDSVDFLRASPAELAEMRDAIRPLARKLAARIARRRRLRRAGRLDVRRTVRRSLSAGGVPLDPAFRHPRATKPDLYLLCDISGSVAEFAHFTMSLLFAMKREFARIRLFVFVDGVDEVTELMDERAAWLAPRNLLYGTKAIAGDGHSDYGNVLERFWHVYGFADIDARSTVIITGDARNNFRDSGFKTLQTMHERAKRVYWLNPEGREEWNTTDSIMSVYGPACDGVFETRNLGQLAEFVVAIA